MRDVEVCHTLHGDVDAFGCFVGQRLLVVVGSAGNDLPIGSGLQLLKEAPKVVFELKVTNHL